jgi:two-component system sensor histidine kinase KdpD
MSDDRAQQFLTLIRRAQRGRHKIYLGYGPGVGKTSLMLQEAHRLVRDGIDVVVAVVETHGRAGTAQLVEGLEVVPRMTMQYHGIAVDEMDIDAVLARHPQVALVDELAHTNVPGGRNDKRYQDVQAMLAAGIHVISTINVQHLESLYDTVEKQIGVRVRERLPDAVISDADQVVNVDLAPEDLQKRLELGEIYPSDRIPAAMENFFTIANLEQLRELTLRELAAQIDFRRREISTDQENGAPDQIMVCLSSRGPNSAQLLRFASRLAGRLNRTWYAVYVQTPTEDPIAIDATTQRLLNDTLTLANQLGATVFTFKGEDIAQTIMRFASEYRVGHVVIGKPRTPVWWQRLLGQASVAERLLYEAHGLTVVVVDVAAADHSGDAVAKAVPPAAIAAPAPATAAIRAAPLLSQLLDASLIAIWTAPVSRHEVLHRLVTAIHAAKPQVGIDDAVGRLEAREQQGSTFLNSGIALPHARLPALTRPCIAIGIARCGISDVGASTDLCLIFLVLTPLGEPTAHLQLLAAASRLFQDREFRRRFGQIDHPQAAVQEIALVEGARA